MFVILSLVSIEFEYHVKEKEALISKVISSGGAKWPVSCSGGRANIVSSARAPVATAGSGPLKGEMAGRVGLFEVGAHKGT